ncbi:hypothetical protein BN946_scf184979.g45 [Trametes cinnabarina]|uniref:NAD(P)-binding domain-containing protein n=1 Tax=Pycnoporus cinnabarinus TaxID=5643 RepID=A0A060SJA8_PYCCI|nr:hypothetical protein BN946_scf184979.g45 [Trametes cinnabarina]
MKPAARQEGMWWHPKPQQVATLTSNMSATVTIFLTGATGYIGGSVLERLLKHPNANTFDITVLVRNAEKAKILESKFGVRVVVGAHQDLDKLEACSENAHIVFQCSDSDDVPATKAILSGLKKRHAKLGDLPILIHTSGTGTLVDDARGMYATDVIYSDLNVEQIKSIPPTAFHRDVDLPIMQADEEGYVRAHIILPATVYGIAQGPLFEAGVSNPHSMQIPRLIRAALDRKLADLYIILLDSVLNNPDKTGHGWEGFYFGENGEHTWYQISRTIGEALVELGLSDDPEPTEFSTEELIKYFGSIKIGLYNGTNSRCRADRSRSIGWKPQYTTEDMLKSIKPEIIALRQRESKA